MPDHLQLRPRTHAAPFQVFGLRGHVYLRLPIYPPRHCYSWFNGFWTIPCWITTPCRPTLVVANVIHCRAYTHATRTCVAYGYCPLTATRRFYRHTARHCTVLIVLPPAVDYRNTALFYLAPPFFSSLIPQPQHVGYPAERYPHGRFGLIHAQPLPHDVSGCIYSTAANYACAPSPPDYCAP